LRRRRLMNEQLKAGDVLRVTLRVELLHRVEDESTLRDEMDLVRSSVACDLLASHSASVSVLQAWKEPGRDEIWPERPR
jgi:hypothetical protein